jgi:hypothetical protein
MLFSGGFAKTWGGLMLSISNYHKENIENFNEHSVYLLGLDSDPNAGPKGSFVAILSTENFLLNAYRQLFWGYPIFMAADTSYRYTQEGHGLYPIITTNVAGQTKVIAYAIISHEHHKAQRKVFEAIKAELERLVNDRKAKGIPID